MPASRAHFDPRRGQRGFRLSDREFAVVEDRRGEDRVGASGGVGTLAHLVDGIVQGGADAVLAASIFHYGEFTIGEAKAAMAAAGIEVRLTPGMSPAA